MLGEWRLMAEASDMSNFYPSAAAFSAHSSADEGPNPAELLEELVAIGSCYPEEGPIAQTVAEMLEEAGFSVRRHEVAPERTNILAEKGPDNKPALLFVGHLDTVHVPAGYAERGLNPFELRFDDEHNVFRGLGAADMKGGLAAVMAALAPLKPQNAKLKLAFTVDEENISLGINRLLRDEADWFKDVRLIISAETGAVPFESRLRFPPVLFITGRLGRFTIKAQIHGPRGHGAYSDPSRNAVMEAARFLMAVDKSREQLSAKHEFLGRSDLSIQSVVSTSEGYTAPYSCNVMMHWLALPDELPTTILQRLQSFVASAYAASTLRNSATPVEFSVPFRETPYAPGYSTPRFGPMLDLVSGVYGDVMGHPARYTMGRSVSDDNFVADRFPEIPLFNLGPKGGDVHTADEWLDASALYGATKLYREVARAFDGIGMFKPFWDALSPHEQQFIAVVVKNGGCSWEHVTDALRESNLNPRRVAEKVAAVVDQFFPVVQQIPGMNTKGDRIQLRDDLRSIMQAGLEYLEVKARATTAIRRTDIAAFPTGEPTPPIDLPSGFSSASADALPFGEALPIGPDAMIEQAQAHAMPLLEEWGGSESGSTSGSVKTGPRSTVSRAPKPPPNATGAIVENVPRQIRPPEPNEETGASTMSRRLRKAPPPPPDGDDGAVRIITERPAMAPPIVPPVSDESSASERRRAPKLPPKPEA